MTAVLLLRDVIMGISAERKDVKQALFSIAFTIGV